MMRTLLLIVRSGVDNQQIVGESIDAALVCSAFGMEVSLLFEGQGLEFTQEPRLRELLKHALPGDFVRVMAHSESLRLPAAPGVEWVSGSRVLESLQSHQEMLVT